MNEKYDSKHSPQLGQNSHQRFLMKLLLLIDDLSCGTYFVTKTKTFVGALHPSVLIELQIKPFKT